MNCPHKAMVTRTSVHHLEGVGRCAVEIRLRCTDCGANFMFLGLPCGLSTAGGAYVSPDGLELRVVAVEEGKALSPVQQMFAAESANPTTKPH